MESDEDRAECGVSGGIERSAMFEEAAEGGPGWLVANAWTEEGEEGGEDMTVCVLVAVIGLW